MSHDETFSPLTRALHHRIDCTDAHPVVTPLFQNSAFSSDSPHFYTRKSNPNYVELEQVMAIIEDCPHVLAVTTGMAAISVVANLLRPGDHVVVNKLVYGCSFKFFSRLAKQRDLKLTTVDLSTPEGLDAIPADASMVFFETPTNPFLKTVDIKAVAARAKASNPECLVVVDNTWATPHYQKPLKLGADICVYSATKFISGHSDVMGGFVSTARDDLALRLREDRFYHGMILDPHSAWLLRRSMYTFGLRMKEHQIAARQIADYIAGLPQVDQIYWPEVDGTQLTGYGCIFFFELRADLVEHYRAFTRMLELFDTGTGMACVTSMVAQPYTGSHASMCDEEKASMGLGRNLIRLCIGMEDLEDLKQDLKQAFDHIEALAAEQSGASRT